MQRLQIYFMIVVVMELAVIPSGETDGAIFGATIFIIYAVMKLFNKTKD